MRLNLKTSTIKLIYLICFTKKCNVLTAFLKHCNIYFKQTETGLKSQSMYTQNALFKFLHLNSCSCKMFLKKNFASRLATTNNAKIKQFLFRFKWLPKVYLSTSNDMLYTVINCCKKWIYWCKKISSSVWIQNSNHTSTS
jgi:hypothetical protein